jgi:hypothetical protein
MTALILAFALAPFAIGLAYALAKQDWSADRPRPDGYANEWAARKAQRPHTSRAR